jgi:GT2 family glycosyltransferase
MNQYPLVTIISVNYKQTEVTCEMLQSLREITYKNIEIIIVDNGSDEDLEKVLSAKFSDAKLIISKENLGFAGGNNLAVKAAKGKYILFLNNDTIVDRGFLEPIITTMEANSLIGMASPKIIFFNTDETIQYAGSTGINPYTGRGAKIGHLEKDNGQYNDIRPTGLVHGAAMVVPLEVIKKVSLMPDFFFLYYEEHDWCEMIERAGYKIYYIGSSKIYHKESISVGRESALKTYYMIRNRLLFMRRNVHGLPFISSMLFFIFLSIPNNTLKYLVKREFKHLKRFYAGIWWNITTYNIHQNNKLI